MFAKIFRREAIDIDKADGGSRNQGGPSSSLTQVVHRIVQTLSASCLLCGISPINPNGSLAKKKLCRNSSCSAVGADHQMSVVHSKGDVKRRSISNACKTCYSREISIYNGTADISTLSSLFFLSTFVHFVT